MYYADAKRRIDELLKLARQTRAAGKWPNARLEPVVMTLRAGILLDRRDAAGYRQTAEMYEALGRTDAVCLYDAGCLRAVLAGLLADQPTAANAAADTAMDWLRKAVAAGYRNRALMLKDADLDPLRGRADFRALLNSLPELAPQPRPVKP